MFRASKYHSHLLQGKRRVDSGEWLAIAPVQERGHGSLDFRSCGQPSNCHCGIALRRINPRVQECRRLLICSISTPGADTPPPSMLAVEGLYGRNGLVGDGLFCIYARPNIFYVLEFCPFHALLNFKCLQTVQKDIADCFCWASPKPKRYFQTIKYW